MNKRGEPLPNWQHSLSSFRSRRVIFRKVIKSSKMVVRVELVGGQTRYPRKATFGSAGIDFFAPEKIIVPPTGQMMSIPTGVKLALPSSSYLQIHGRSGLALQGLLVHPGVIDSDYRGQIMIIARNISDQTIIIEKRAAFAQAILHPCLAFCWKEDKVEARETARGAGGFGSTSTTFETRQMSEKEREIRDSLMKPENYTERTKKSFEKVRHIFHFHFSCISKSRSF